MINGFYKIINACYEVLAPYTEYSLDENENIVKTEKNTALGTTNFVYFLVTISLIFLGGLITNVVFTGMQHEHGEKVFLNKYSIQQICIDNSTWNECYGFPKETTSRLFLDVNNPIKTLYIKED